MVYLIFFILFVFTYKVGVVDNENDKQHIINSVTFITASILCAEVLSLLDVFTIYSLRRITMVLLLIYIFVQFNNIYYIIKKITIPKSLFFYALSLFVALWFFQALSYFPTNYDSSTYHLPRIIMWLQNKSLNHFPTPTYRMLYQPYLSEVIFAFIYSTCGTLSFMRLWSVVLVILLVKVLYLAIKLITNRSDFKIFEALIVILLCWSIVLQCVTTLNDIQLLYFIVTFNLGLWLFINKNEGYALLLLSLVLGYLTKGTSSLYLAFNIIIWVMWLLHKRICMEVVRRFILINLNKIFLIFLTVLLLLPTTIRNVKICGSILGTPVSETIMYKNDPTNLKSGLSNTLKNFAMHSGTPIEYINNFNTSILFHINNFLKLPSPNDKGLNWAGGKFLINGGFKYFFYPEKVSNMLLFYLSLGIFLWVVVIFLFRFKTNRVGLVYLIITLISFSMLFLFSFVLRWQPWHTRLLLPVFLMQSIGVVLYLSTLQSRNFFYAFIYASAFVAVIFNSNQPVLASSRLTVADFTKLNDKYKIKRAWANEFSYNEINRIIGSEKRVAIYLGWYDERIFPYMCDARDTKNEYDFTGGFSNPSTQLLEKLTINNYDFVLTTLNDVQGLKKEYDMKHFNLAFQNQKWILFKIDEKK